ncbi:unnamed protein product [Allacma fusca]|uniref:Gustatory receptor n=1 Tax=Allacma fusca TaxID=39272 RepID=A0A8J2L0J6_9HEXA|nr:unnamed protein product [Allacma fusca]
MLNDWLILTVVNYGRVALCMPILNFNRDQTCERALTLIFKLLQFLIVFIAVGVECDTFLVNSIEKLIGSFKLSDHITYILVCSSYAISNLFIRLGNVLHTQDLQEFVTSVTFLSKSVRIKSVQGIGFILIAFSFLPLLLFVTFDIFLSDIKSFDVSNLQLNIFPSQLAIHFHFIEIISTYGAVIYAYLFIVIFGVLIVHIFEQYVSNLDKIYLRPVTGPSAICMRSFEKFKEEIFVLKQVMDTYAEIAGIYLLGVLSQAALNWFRFLDYITNDKKVSFLADSMIVNVFSVTAIGYIACFGNYVNKRSHRLKGKLLAADVNIGTSSHPRISKLLTWIISWDWKLSVLDMCDLNHATIPTVISAILPCMILIFQLRMSENET